MKNKFSLKTVLTIAGSDSIGGAGIQADIKTMTCLGVYAMSAVTALTAQNTTGVTDIMETTPEFLQKQLDCIFTDIMPDAVKTGMVANENLVKAIAVKLKYYNAKNIVVDPVMVSTSGTKLINDNSVKYMKLLLFPMATVITPNIPEAEILSGTKIINKVDMEYAAKKIGEEYGCAVLCKGGHSVNYSDDVLFCKGNLIWYKTKKINNPNTHGTGCTLSSAIASYLAQGYNLEKAVMLAKKYLTNALKTNFDIGKGTGPLAHNYKITKGRVL